MQDQMQKLLVEVAFKNGTLKEAKRLYADRLAPDFNIFDYLRDDEMGLSQCIASLLNPEGTHGQGSVFLESFLKCIDQLLPGALNLNWSETATDVCQIKLENQANGQRRIDIYLRFNNGEIIGIENKPWAGDQKNQLKDYVKFIKDEVKDKKWLLIYLSNYEPSEYSITKEQRKKLEESGEFVTLNYETLIEWLQDCAYRSKALVVRLYIEELSKFIRMKVNRKLDMSEEEEMKNIILKSKENIESAFHVLKAIKSVKKELLENFHDDLKVSLKAEGFELVWDDSMSKDWRSAAGFGVKFSMVQSFYLRFEFQKSGLFELDWGIRRDESNKYDSVFWNNFYEKMNEKFGIGKKNNMWPWWSVIHNNNQEFSEEFRNWDSSEIPWIAIQEKKLAAKITNIAKSAHDAFNECPNIIPNDVVRQVKP